MDALAGAVSATSLYELSDLTEEGSICISFGVRDVYIQGYRVKQESNTSCLHWNAEMDRLVRE